MPEKFPYDKIDEAAQRLIGEHQPLHELSDEVKRFWEKGKVKTAPKFKNQLRDATEDPTRQNKIYAAPRAIIGIPGYFEAARSKVEFTEAEGLQDLDDYLQLVIDTASTENSDIARSVAASAYEFRRHFSFIGRREFDEAVDGVAQAWAAYLSQGPDYIMNVYTWSVEGSRDRSYTSIINKIAAQLQTVLPPEILSRLRTNMDEWEETEHSKLVGVDDWMTTGTTMEKRIKNARQAAEVNGKAKLASRAEIHLLIARKGQVGSNPNGYFVRSYFETDNDLGPFSVVPSGAHSSVDNGFEHIFERFGMFLRDHKVLREPPLLAYIDRPYSSKIANLSSGELAYLHELAAVNKRLVELSETRKQLEKQWKGLMGEDQKNERDNLEAQTEAIIRQLISVSKRQRELSELLKPKV